MPDALTRLDRAFHAYFAYFRRIREGQTAGDPRFQGANRYTSCPDQPFGNGATREHGLLVLSKVGRSALRWSRPMEPPDGAARERVEGAPKTVTLSREAEGG